MKIAAAYIRVSTDDQIEFSPASQISRIREYAKRNDYILPDEFIYMDEGISGRKAEKRPQFMKMIGMAKSKPKPFDAILLWKFSRFARNREDSIVYKSMLRKQHGIDVISVSENLGDDKMSILIEALIEAMDEFYSINLSEEVKRGMTEKAKRGGVLSIPPFGYKVENGAYVPVEDEAAIIRRVFADYCSGVGMLRIAKNLNALGVRTHRGSKIENRTIEYWLNNPMYIGKIRWTPTGKTSRNYHNKDSMIVDGQHEAIIDNETWERTQVKMKEQKEKYRKYYSPRDKISHWLVGLCHCSLCGGPLVNCSGYLYCNNRGKGTCTGNGSIKAELLETLVIDNMKSVIAASAPTNITIQSRSSIRNDKPDIYAAQLAAAENRMMRIREAYEAGIDTLEEYGRNKAKINVEIAQIRAQMKRDKPEQTEDDRFDALRANIKDALDIITSPAASAAVKNSAARGFIADIIKRDNTFDIEYYA